jgi:methylenetetrahydrofolate dehydrogenase (NADP+) / methenyltetrahydrofolate cyclohydrolase
VTALALAGAQVAARLRAATSRLLADTGIEARLAVVIATRAESAWWYVRSLGTAAAKLGIRCDVSELPADASGADVTAALAMLSADISVHGILLQTPLPAGPGLAELAAAIDPAKDVDGASPISLGRLMAGLPSVAPATAQAVLQLLDGYAVELTGRRAVVVGRSIVVGKPVAQLLLARDATVTVCHSRTRDLAAVTREADVLVVAAGKPRLVTAAHVRPGAVVIDVGANTAADGSLVGDVDAESVSSVAAALSPVPRGLGPVTTAQLLLTTVTAAARQQRATKVG